MINITEQNSNLRKHEFNLFSRTTHYIGEPVEVRDPYGIIVATGEVVQCYSEEPKYKNAKKHLDGKLVNTNSGERYYRIKVKSVV